MSPTWALLKQFYYYTYYLTTTLTSMGLKYNLNVPKLNKHSKYVSGFRSNMLNFYYQAV